MLREAGTIILIVGLALFSALMLLDVKIYKPYYEKQKAKRQLEENSSHSRVPPVIASNRNKAELP